MDRSGPRRAGPARAGSGPPDERSEHEPRRFLAVQRDCLCIVYLCVFNFVYILIVVYFVFNTLIMYYIVIRYTVFRYTLKNSSA